MTIKWDAFLIVAGTTWVSALAVVALYSLAVRLMAVAEDDGRSRAVARSGAYACFGLCALVVLLGIVLIVPSLSEAILGIS
jgi:hypothetical protein